MLSRRTVFQGCLACAALSGLSARAAGERAASIDGRSNRIWFVGGMRETIMNGKLDGALDLATLAGRPHLYRIADATGLTSVYVNRTLQRLRDEGLIAVDGKRWSVLDAPGVRKAADFNPNYLHYERGRELISAMAGTSRDERD
jgi:hypothetical protein